MAVINSGTTLTIGPNITIEGGYGTIGYSSLWTNVSESSVSFVNQGTIISNVAGGPINLDGGAWTNSGSIEASNGGSLNLLDTWSNSGSLSISGTGSLNLDGTWSSTSTITAAAGATVGLNGTVANTGNTLQLSGAATWNLSGTINGGTVALSNGAALSCQSGTLNGVTLDGNLNVTAVNRGSVTVTDGLTLNGTVTLGSASNYDALQFVGTQTLGGSGTVTLDTASNTLTAVAVINSGTTLTIGPNITIEGGYGTIGYSSLWTNVSESSVSFVNQGTIISNVAGGPINLDGGAWTNSGSIEATSGGTLTMSTAPTNLALGMLTGATWIVGANSTMSLDANITIDAANIILNGTGANFSSLSPLAEIASDGSLEILNGEAFTTAGNLDNAGTVDLSPGTLNVNGNYTQEAGGTFDVAVGGLTAGTQSGQIRVTNQASLNGGLDISLINSYTPPQGDSYAVLTFGSETGNFVAEFGLYFGGGEGFSPTFSPSSNPTALDLVVIAEAVGTQTTVQSSENPSNYGDTVTFTATVTPTVSTNLTPTGTVIFFDGVSDLGSATLVNGSATFATATVAGGLNSIVAQYNGDSNFSGSNSSPITQTVNPIASQTALQSSEDPSFYTESVTFTATVSSSSSAPGLATPSGQVEFLNGSTLLDTATLSGGTASFTTTALGVGANQQIEASYLGDTNYNPSNFTITQTVTSPSLATLGGEVYNDPNNSGTPVSGAGLSGWTVTLLSGPTPVATTTTDSSGDYSFTNVFPARTRSPSPSCRATPRRCRHRAALP